MTHKIENGLIFSHTASQHGFGTAPYKWVSGASREEMEICKRGGIVLFDDGVKSGGTHGTTLRMMVRQSGRYIPRVPSNEVIRAAIQAGIIPSIHSAELQ